MIRRRMSPARRARILADHGGICGICGRAIEGACEIDHVVARAPGVPPAQVVRWRARPRRRERDRAREADRPQAPGIPSDPIPAAYPPRPGAGPVMKRHAAMAALIGLALAAAWAAGAAVLELAGALL